MVLEGGARGGQARKGLIFGIRESAKLFAAGGTTCKHHDGLGVQSSGYSKLFCEVTSGGAQWPVGEAWGWLHWLSGAFS